MISLASPSIKPLMPSMVCCSAPGRSTESRMRTAMKNSVSSNTTSNSIAKLFEMGVSRMLGMNVQRLQQCQDGGTEQTI